MVTWGVAGSSPFADLSASEHVLAKNKLVEKWSLTGALGLEDALDSTNYPKGTRVKIGAGWEKIVNTYEIHCVRGEGMGPQKVTVGWGMQKKSPRIDIHVFVKRTTGGEEPAELGQLEREISRIIGQEKALQTGTLWTEGGYIRADDPENIGPVRYWHRIIESTFDYFQVSTV